MAIRLVLIENNPIHQAALIEQFSVMKEFLLVYAGPVAGMPSEAGTLSHVDAFLTAEDDFTAVDKAAEAGFDGPVISFQKNDRGALYLARPCRFSSLTALIRSGLHDHVRSDNARFTLGPYLYHPDQRMLVSEDFDNIQLTDKEAAILRYLYRAGSRPVPRDELLGEVWGYQSGITTHTLETHIYRLRQKIEPDPTEASLLITVDGGYTLGSRGINLQSEGR